MVTGSPFISRKMPMKSPFCIGRILASAFSPPFHVLGQDHLAHRSDPVGLEEHVLGAAQADPFGAELAGDLGILRRIGIGAHPEPAELVDPAHEGAEIAGQRRRHGRHLRRA